MARMIGSVDLDNPGNVGVRELVDMLGGPGRGGGTRKLAESWAEARGLSVKSQMRAVQRAMRSDAYPAKLPSEANAAGERRAAAARLQTGGGPTRVNAGRVAVKYDGRFDGKPRRVNLRTFTPNGRRLMEQAGRALEEGRTDLFESRMSEAVMDSFHGLGGTLEAADYLDGYDVIF